MATKGVVLPQIDNSVVAVTAYSPFHASKESENVNKSLQKSTKSKLELESWPVHSLHPAPSSLSMGHTGGATSSMSLVPKASPKQDRDQIVPKPKLLEHLESYLARELRLLGCQSGGPCQLRLQAHREAFDFLINEFKTYKPMLSTIKNEYERYIESLQSDIVTLKPLQSQLATVLEDCDRKLLAFQEQEKGDLMQAKQEIGALVSQLQQMQENEKTLHAQITRLQEELAVQYELCRNEADARKLLISDINDLRARQLEEKSSGAGQTDVKDDPVVLKLKLARIREDLKTANKRINTMLADYGDVVPRKDYERLESSLQLLETEHEQIKNDHLTLIEEHSVLQSMCGQLSNEKDDLQSDLATLKRTATPRPEWDRCGGYVEGGPEKWKVVSEGQSSDRLVDVLLAEIADIDINELRKEDIFPALGTSDNVPMYLRAEGKIRNRHFSKKELYNLINGFWQYKFANEVPEQPIDEALWNYLLEKSGQAKDLAIETGYNLKDGCTKMAHEYGISIFTKILDGELNEIVYSRWLQNQALIADSLGKRASDQGELSEGALKESIEEVFPKKAATSVSLLVKAAKESCVDGLKITTLLSDEQTGSPTTLVSCLLEQSREECTHFVKQVTKLLDGKSEVTVDELKAAILAVQPHLPQEEITRVVSQVFGIHGNQQEAAHAVIKNKELFHKLVQLDLQNL